jgi:hypothetical protein
LHVLGKGYCYKDDYQDDDDPGYDFKHFLPPFLLWASSSVADARVCQTREQSLVSLLALDPSASKYVTYALGSSGVGHPIHHNADLMQGVLVTTNMPGAGYLIDTQRITLSVYKVAARETRFFQ